MSLIDQAFGISPQVLTVRAKRLELIAANLANADTPGYKAMDLDFRQALQRAEQSAAATSRSHPEHLDIDVTGADEPLYRTPGQWSLDGNTVETDQEHAAFMDNAIRYQASLNFLDSRVKSVISALRGE